MLPLDFNIFIWIVGGKWIFLFILGTLLLAIPAYSDYKWGKLSRMELIMVMVSSLINLNFFGIIFVALAVIFLKKLPLADRFVFLQLNTFTFVVFSIFSLFFNKKEHIPAVTYVFFANVVFIFIKIIIYYSQ